jgi:hypothetical protein
MTNGQNNWGVGWAAIRFFDTVLSGHSAVTSFERVNDIQFEIERRRDLPSVNAVLIDEYMLGKATVYGLLQEFHGVTVVVNNGNWNHIAFDSKAFAKKTGVVVLMLADFLGALNGKDLGKYVPPEEREERDSRRKKSS